MRECLKKYLKSQTKSHSPNLQYIGGVGKHPWTLRPRNKFRFMYIRNSTFLCLKLRTTPKIVQLSAPLIYFIWNYLWMAQKSKILIIGGTGYIGKYIVEESTKAGHPTFALVRENTASNSEKSRLIQSFKSSGVTLLHVCKKL